MFDGLPKFWFNIYVRDSTHVTRRDNMQVGNIITIQMHGRSVKARVLAIHAFGTIDLQRLSDGACFRVTGLSIK